MRLLLDEMYPPRLAEELRKRGHDVSAVTELPGLRSTEDSALLEAATAQDRILVTENVADFPDIATLFAIEDRAYCGVILVARETFPRSERGLGKLVRALDIYLKRRVRDTDVLGGMHWLKPAEAATST